MFPSLKDGDLVLAFRLSDDVQKDDIVVCEAGGDRCVMRVVARGGDVVTVDETGNLLVNGTNQAGEIVFPTYVGDANITYPYAVPTGHVFVLGDYRTEAEETRETTRELGIAFVSYSPLGRGFLTGKITDPSLFAVDDFRRNLPRFQAETMRKNQQLLDRLQQVAGRYDATLAQMALAWVMSKGEDIVPIPGARKINHLRDIAANDYGAEVVK